MKLMQIMRILLYISFIATSITVFISKDTGAHPSLLMNQKLLPEPFFRVQYEQFERLPETAGEPTVVTTFRPKGSSSKTFAKAQQKRSYTLLELVFSIIGCLLMWISVVLIFYTERQLVKYTNFIDWADEKIAEYSDIDTKNPMEGIPYIVKGVLSPASECDEYLELFDQKNISLANYIGLNKEHLAHIGFNFEEYRKVNSETNIGMFIESPRHSFQINSKTTIGNLHLDTDVDFIQAMPRQSADLSGDIEKVKHLLVSKLKYDLKTLDVKYIQQKDIHYFYIFNKEERVSQFDPLTYPFEEGDMRLNVSYSEFQDNKIFSFMGMIDHQTKTLKCLTFPHSHAKCECNYWPCWAGTTEEKLIVMNDKEVVDKTYCLNFLEKRCKPRSLYKRLLGFALHFLAWFLIIYSLFLLGWKIPFVGTVGGTSRIFFFSLMFSFITVLLVIAIAWIWTRPKLALFLLCLILVLLLLTRIFREKMNFHTPNLRKYPERFIKNEKKGEINHIRRR